jgi:putative ABC transport system permease protein
MRDEFAFHLESRATDLIREGLSPGDARRRAQLEFGSVESYKEQTREARSPRVLEDLIRDIGYGCRGLRRSPALVLTCVFSLGIGIGVNATIFTALRSVLLHQPTASDSERVVGVEPGNSNQMSYPNYRDLRDSGIFDDVAAYRIVRVNLRVDGSGERVLAAVVTGNFFEALGVQPRLGRAFIAGAESPERHPRVVVLSDDFWRRRFNKDPAVVGRIVHLNGGPVDVVGILPDDYRAVTPIGQPDVYVPISELFLPRMEKRENANGLTVIARLRGEDSPRHAQMAVTRLGEELERRYPGINRGLSRPAAVFPLRALVLRRAPPEMVLLPVIVLALFGLVLLIACGNVAGLLLARAATRRHEIAVRVALGAKRARLVQTLLAEAMILGIISAAGGVLLTLGVIPILNAVTLPGQLPLRLSIAPDAWLIGYAVFLALVTTVACGLVPALRGTRVNVSSELHETGQTRGTRRLRLRHGFVIGQVALSAFLLVLSALLVQTAARAATLDPGFDLGSGIVASVALDRGRSDESRLLLAEQLTDRLALLPDVRSVSVANIVPLAGDVVRRGFEVRGREAGDRFPTLVNVVGPRYFETMGIALVRGRGFRWTDRSGAPPVVIVNQAFVRRSVNGGDPLGMFIRTGDEAFAEVVGVAADTKFLSLTEDPQPLVYYSYGQRPSDPIVHVRVAGEPEASLRAIQLTAEALDATAIVGVETLRQAAGLEIALRRGAGILLASLGGLGLLLALVGLYGLMAYTVASRRAEIGLRMALGASAGQVVSLVVAHALKLIAIGLAIGASASLLLTIPLRAQLAGVSPVDPIALATTAMALLAGGLCASYLPARRATRVDPIIALRQQ